VNVTVRAEADWRNLTQAGKYKSYADFITRYIELSEKINLDDAAKVRGLKQKVHEPLRKALKVQRGLPGENEWDKWLAIMNELASNEEALNFEEGYRANQNQKGKDANGNGGGGGGGGGSGVDDPMDLDAMGTKSDKQKIREQRFEKGLCLKCGKPGHFAKDHDENGRPPAANYNNAANGNGRGGRGGRGGNRGGFNGNQGGGRGWNDPGGWNGQQNFQYGNNYGLGQNGQQQQTYQRGGGYQQRGNYQGQGGRGGPYNAQNLRGRVIGELDDHGGFRGFGHGQGNGGPSQGFSRTRLEKPKPLYLAHGELSDWITNSVHVVMRIGHHRENIEFYLTNLSRKNPVILGLPWLQKHNPDIDWSVPSLTFREHCVRHCLPEGLPAQIPDEGESGAESQEDTDGEDSDDDDPDDKKVKRMRKTIEAQEREARKRREHRQRDSLERARKRALENGPRWTHAEPSQRAIMIPNKP
ncbi:hypothetical protein QBC37DRAFT_254192, partial [Rhypophila decipiens]